jgi:CHAT domain-containing protein/Tfp pilus assembly protein PilF
LLKPRHLPRKILIKRKCYVNILLDCLIAVGLVGFCLCEDGMAIDQALPSSPGSRFFSRLVQQPNPPEVEQFIRQLQDSDTARAILERIVVRIQSESVDLDEDLNRFTESLLEQLRSHQHWALAEMFLASWQRDLERMQASAASPEDAIAATISYLITSLNRFPSVQPGTTGVNSLHQMIQQLQAESSRPQPALANFNQRFADLIRSQADPELRQRRLNQAYAQYETVLSLYEQTLGPNHPLTNRIRQELLVFYGIAGDTVRSQRLMATQLETLEPQLGDAATPFDRFSLDQEWTNSPQGQLLGLYQWTGNYRQAEAILRQTLEATSTAADKAFLLVQLGTFLNAQGDYQGGLSAFEQANDLAATLWQANPRAASNPAALSGYRFTLTALAGSHLVLGHYDQAEALWQEAHRLEAELPGYLPSAENMDPLRAHLYRRQGAYDQAETIWRRWLDHQPTNESTLNVLAELSWARGNLAQAVEFRQRALAVEEDQIIRALSAASDQESQDYIAQFRDSVSVTVSFSLSAADHPPAVALGLTNVLQRKGRTLDLLASRQRYLQEQLSLPTQRLLVQLEEVRSHLSNLIFQPDQPDPQQLNRLQAEAARLEQQIASSTNLVPDNLSGVTAAAVQQQLPAQTALVEYVLYQPYDLNQPFTQALGAPRYMAYVLHPQGDVAAIDLGDAATIDGQVEDLRRQLQHPFTSLDAVHQAGRQLHQLLIEPLPLGTAEHLLLAPDGQLNLIPFAALVDDNQRYLVERYRLTHLTSGRDLLKVPAPASSNPPLLLGNPDYSQAAQPATVSTHRGVALSRAPELGQLQFAQLPGTEAEVTTIAQLLGQATVLTGATATETALKQAQAPRILHIATHGFFLEDIAPPPSSLAQRAAPNISPSMGMRAPIDRPDALQTHPLLRSGLALAGFNPRQSTPDDGVLTALEASTLNLQGTQLVVLSACETGVGDVATGEGVYGLRRALTLAGAESLLTSLWQVDDQATKDLMVDYYQRLLDQAGRSEALRQAQLAMRQNPTYRHPYYWAALVFSGDWRPLYESFT